MVEFRVQYQEELARLEAQAMGAFDLVEQALQRTVEAVERRDIELANLVIDGDDQLDGRYLEVHQGLIALLATQSPVATDLRLIAALLHVLKDAERMGDQCVNVCKLIPLVGHEPPADAELVRLVVAMGEQAGRQVAQARQAFVARDLELAYGLVTADNLIDELNRECFKVALAVGDETDRREWAMTMLLAARALERIGDHTVDVGEQVAFVVTGLFREFEDASHPQAGQMHARRTW
jgi:phosphate transport system protein